jgi:spermidine/putrescine transport system ATP-binding protein
VTSEPIVVLEQLSKSYGDVPAVRAIDLEIGNGELFALLGPSGCGKTTTLKLIAGFEQPSSGRVLVHGQPMQGVPAFRRDVNTVFQNYALFPHLDLRDNVAFGLRMRKVPKRERRARAEAALERVQLPGVSRRRPDELSGGQQQRVALARALVNEPSVLLLDEPLGALDLKLRRAMQVELKEIQRSVGISFVFVTHDQHEALAMADRIAVMHDGRVQQVGTPQEIYEQPRSRFVAEFIGESGFLHGTVEGVTGDTAAVRLASGERVAARTSSPAAAGDEVSLAIRPEHVTLDVPASPTPGTNVVRGRLVSAEYVGSDSYYKLDAGAAGDIIVRQTGAGNPVAPGQDVPVAFDAARTVVLADDGGSPLAPDADVGPVAV